MQRLDINRWHVAVITLDLTKLFRFYRVYVSVKQSNTLCIE